MSAGPAAPEAVARDAGEDWVVSTILRPSGIMAAPGLRHYETMAFDVAGRVLYQRAEVTRRSALRAHEIIARRVARLRPGSAR